MLLDLKKNIFKKGDIISFVSYDHTEYIGVLDHDCDDDNDNLIFNRLFCVSTAHSSNNQIPIIEVGFLTTDIDAFRFKKYRLIGYGHTKPEVKEILHQKYQVVIPNSTV